MMVGGIVAVMKVFGGKDDFFKCFECDRGSRADAYWSVESD